MEAVPAHIRRHPFPHDLVHALLAVSVTNWRLCASSSSHPAPDTPGYRNVLQRCSSKSIFSLFNGYLLPDSTNTADTHGCNHEFHFISRTTS